MLTFALALTAFASTAETRAAEPIPVLIVSGANNHDWHWTAPELEKLLEASGLFAADITNEPAKVLADRKAIARYKVFVLDYNGPRWGPQAEAGFLGAVQAGTGVTVIHAANNAFEGWQEYERLVGYLWRDGTGHGKFHAFDVTLIDRDHPITRGMFDLRAHPDELYHKLWRAPGTDHRVLATAWSSVESGGTGAAEPMITVGSYGKGRVFHTPLGHTWEKSDATRASYADPQFRELVVRGTEWAATGACSGASSTHNQLSKAETSKAGACSSMGRLQRAGPASRRPRFRPGRGRSRTACSFHPQRTVRSRQRAHVRQLRARVRLARRSQGQQRRDLPRQRRRRRDLDLGARVPGDRRRLLRQRASAAAVRGGALRDHAPGGAQLAPVGEFNRGRIVVDGWRIEHWLNGQLCSRAISRATTGARASRRASSPSSRSSRSPRAGASACRGTAARSRTAT
jgi:type 1 glutamine amidotransferase